MIVLGIDPGPWSAEAQRAYIAGLLDGEGYIGVKRRMPTAVNKLTSPKYSPCVSIAMTDLAPVEFVAAFVGAVGKVKPRSRPGKLKTIYQLDLENSQAVALLVEVAAFLICKRERAHSVLRLAELRKSSRAHRTQKVADHVHARALAPAFNMRCDEIYAELLVGAPRSGQAGRWGARA